MPVEDMLRELGDRAEAELLARAESRQRPGERSRLVLVVAMVVFAVGAASVALIVRTGGADDPGTTTELPAAYQWRTLSEPIDWGVLPSVITVDGSVFSFSSTASYELDPETGTITPLANPPGSILIPGAVSTPEGIVVAGVTNDESTGFAAALYDPDAGAWTDLGTAPLQPGESVEPRTLGAWDGSAITWWGVGTPDAAGPTLRLDLRTREWSRGAAPDLTGRGAAASATDGDQLLVWGGCNIRVDVQCDDVPEPSPPADDGAILDLRSGEWRALPPDPLVAGSHPRAAWVGDTEVLVTGGAGTRSAALFDTTTWTWSAIEPPPIELQRGQILIGTDGGAVLLGGIDETGFASPAAAAWDGDTRTWTSLPEAPVGLERHAAIAIGEDEIVALGGAWATPAMALRPLSTVATSTTTSSSPTTTGDTDTDRSAASEGLELLVPAGWHATTNRLFGATLAEPDRSVTIATFPLDELPTDRTCAEPVAALNQLGPTDAIVSIRYGNLGEGWANGPHTPDDLLPQTPEPGALLGCIDRPVDFNWTSINVEIDGRPAQIRTAAGSALSSEVSNELSRVLEDLVDRYQLD